MVVTRLLCITAPQKDSFLLLTIYIVTQLKMKETTTVSVNWRDYYSYYNYYLLKHCTAKK